MKRVAIVLPVTVALAFTLGTFYILSTRSGPAVVGGARPVCRRRHRIDDAKKSESDEYADQTDFDSYGS